MYPFKTDFQKITLNSSEKEVEEYFLKQINEKKLFQISYDSEFYGKVKNQYARIELGQFPNRNACKPIVMLKWQQKEDKTTLESYFRLDNRIVLTFAMLPFIGIFQAIEQKIILPFVFTSIISVLVFSFAIRFAYNRGRESTREKLTELLERLMQ